MEMINNSKNRSINLLHIYMAHDATMSVPTVNEEILDESRWLRAEIGWLRVENAELRAENAELRRRLEEISRDQL